MLTTELHDGITVLRLKHGKVNAFDLELMRRWIDEITLLERAETPAVVLTGTGSVFSAGVDLRQLIAGGREYVQEFVPLLGDMLFKTFTFPKPLVAAVNGHAVAGGCLLACACDYRVMSEGEGRIGVPELSVGVPFPSVAMEILRLTLPNHRLQSLIYGGLTCAPSEALTNGFVDELAESGELLSRALAMANRLGSLPPASFRLTKRMIRQPSRDRMVHYMRAIDEEVLEAWQSSSVLSAVDEYVQRTLKK
jgi:enoyl-CoA hydratase